MDKSLGSWKLGTEGTISADIKGGNVVVAVTYDGAEMAGTFSMTIKSKAGLDKLKSMIPGTYDDVIINILEGALGL